MLSVLPAPTLLRRIAAVCAMSFALATTATPMFAQVVTVGTKPVVGSSNPATAEPPVTRPTNTPCIETLYQNQRFGDYSAKPISHTPVSGCGTTWSKVVLTLDFTVTAGRQFDRTASLYLGNANIYYGTTAEPRSTLSPSWHIERDVTDLSDIFRTAQTGQAIVYNIVDGTYTGVIYGTAQLLFYPVDANNPAAVVPNKVIPVSGVNSPYELDNTSSQLTTTVTAPTNTTKAYLDVIAQSQSADEFWYLSVPDDVSAELQSAGGTSFRETEITIDGKPAGVAPVYPWIYTGGIDPYLWEPIVGVQTLNFKPYRVDLTPFAGVLSDGQPHTVGVSVYNAASYFLATANLLLYTDPLVGSTGGGLLNDTLDAAPTPVITENLTTGAAGAVTGTVEIASKRKFAVKGYVNTSQGRVVTTVQQTVKFDSTQTFNIGNNYVQNAVQTSTVDSTTTNQSSLGTEQIAKSISFPLTLDYSYIANADKSFYYKTTSNQKDVETETRTLNGATTFSSSVAEEVQTTDSLNYSASNVLLSATPTFALASYLSQDSLGNCFSRQVTSKGRAVSLVSDGVGCKTTK